MDEITTNHQVNHHEESSNNHCFQQLVISVTNIYILSCEKKEIRRKVNFKGFYFPDKKDVRIHLTQITNRIKTIINKGFWVGDFRPNRYRAKHIIDQPLPLDMASPIVITYFLLGAGRRGHESGPLAFSRRAEEGWLVAGGEEIAYAVHPRPPPATRREPRRPPQKRWNSSPNPHRKEVTNNVRHHRKELVGVPRRGQG